MHIFSVICKGNSGFSREYGHIFPLPEGIWKYPREFEIFKFTRVFPNSRRQREYMSIFTRKTRISYIFFSSFPVLCNTKHFLLAYMSIFPRKTRISYIFLPLQKKLFLDFLLSLSFDIPLFRSSNCPLVMCI